MSNALRDVLEQHANDVHDLPAPDRVSQVHRRVRAARRRRTGAGAVAAVLAVVVTAVGVSTLTGDDPDASRPGPAGSHDDRVVLESAGSGRGLNELTAYVDVPTTALHFEYWCPSGGGWLVVTVDGHTLVDGDACGPDKVEVSTDGAGIELEDGTVVEPGEMAQVELKLYDTTERTEVSQQRDNEIKLTISKDADPRVRRVGDEELPETVQPGPDESWELVEVRSSEPGATSFSTEVEPGQLVVAVLGYDVSADITGPGPETGTLSTSGPIQRPVGAIGNSGRTEPDITGGRFAITLTQSPDPDGVIGFALYRTVN